VWKTNESQKTEKQELRTDFAMNDSIRTDRAPAPVGLYPHARRVGNLLFLSGVGPRRAGTKEIPGVTLDPDGVVTAYDIEAQCRSVFENVRLILEDSGSSWDRLVDVTVYLTNMKDDFATYNRLWAEYFSNEPPCRTTVEVNALPTPIAIELKCIATVGEK
jgi:2-aminomuconate deaminase